MYSVKDRIVLVTGANRGIGRSTVEEFVRNGAKKVYAAARNPESLNALVAEHAGRVVPLRIDLNVPESITAAAEIARDVEIVINNAGMLNIANPLSDNAIPALKDEMEVNVHGLIRMAQAFAPVLKANGGGAFVQLNSVVSMKSFADFATYSASKAAAYSVTQALRDALKAQGTRVVSVHPGPIATDMADSAGLREVAEPAELVPQAIIEALAADEFHAFAGSLAREMGSAYHDFASHVVEANLSVG